MNQSLKRTVLALVALGVGISLSVWRHRSTQEPNQVAAKIKVNAFDAAEWKDFMNRQTSNDVEQKLNATAKTLTSAQTQALLRVVRDPATPTGQKVLSTYLLVNADAFAELTELITEPAITPGQASTPHGKTLKLMAIDGLSTRAKRDPRARAVLAHAIADTTDPSVKAYAQTRFKTLEVQ